MGLFDWLFGRRSAEDISGARVSGNGSDGGSNDGPGDDLDPRVLSAYPVALRPYAERIEATRRPYLAVTQLEGVPEKPNGSQLGGTPWWPAGLAYPTDSAGIPLRLLMQINFDDAPVLDGFPERGLLQFFIGHDDLLGAEIDGDRASAAFACVFHEAADGAGTDLSETLAAMPAAETPFTPAGHIAPLTLAHDTMVMTPSHHQFPGMLFGDGAPDHALWDAYAQSLNTGVTPIRLGGYADFTQDDPRGHHPSLGDVDLATVGTTSGILWGDVGVAQFFIHRADLDRRDFSNVVYTWDCH